MNATNSFCKNSSCNYYRSHATIFSEELAGSSRNFFSFKYISC